MVIGHALVRRLVLPTSSYILDTKGLEMLEKRADMKKVLAVLIENNFIPKNSTWNTIKFYRSSDDSSIESFDGYVGLHEVLKMTQGVKDLVREGASPTNIYEHARKAGMVTLFEDGIIACVRGLTTLDEVMRTIL